MYDLDIVPTRLHGTNFIIKNDFEQKKSLHFNQDNCSNAAVFKTSNKLNKIKSFT